MKHIIKHDLELRQAKAVLSKALKSYQEKYSEYKPTYEWTRPSRADLSFVVKGVQLTGAVQLLKQGIVLELEVPFLFRPFKKKALAIIEREIQTWIDRAEAEAA